MQTISQSETCIFARNEYRDLERVPLESLAKNPEFIEDSELSLAILVLASYVSIVEETVDIKSKDRKHLLGRGVHLSFFGHGVCIRVQQMWPTYIYHITQATNQSN